MAGLAGLSQLAACDPCSGVASCNVAPRAAWQGQLLEESTGQPVAGATIDFVRTGGVELTVDSLRTVTDAEGAFSFRVDASAVGEVVGDIVVRLPQGGGYRAPGQRFRTTTVRGEGSILPPWSTALRLPDFAAIYRRGHPKEFLGNVRVDFHQTAGPPTNGIVNGSYTAVTQANGWISLFGGLVQPFDAGDIVGDLTIDSTGPLRTVHRDVHIPVQVRFHAAAGVREFGAGPNFDYYVTVVRRGTDAATGGVKISFQQLAGVNLTPPQFDIVTDFSGRAFFQARASSHGSVTADLTVTPPNSWKVQQLRGMQIPTYDADEARLLDSIRVGPALSYYVVITRNDAPLKDVPVEFQRTGGVAVIPSGFTVKTDAAGIARLVADPPMEGEVVADITVRPPAPDRAFSVRGIKLLAVDADIPRGGIHLADWDVTAPPQSAVRAP